MRIPGVLLGILLRKMQLVNFLRGKGKFGDYVGIGGIAIEGIRFCGYIETIFLPETVEIIFHM